MAKLFADKIIKRIEEASELYYRLILLIAPIGAVKNAALPDVPEHQFMKKVYEVFIFYRCFITFFIDVFLILSPISASSAIQRLKQQITKKPQTFQELHPQFLKEIGGWQKYEKSLELSELLEQSFLRFDGKGEVPNQIHSYLSKNFKELRNSPKEDEHLRAKGKDRWYVLDPNKAGDLEKLRERSLLKEFQDYVVPASSQRKLKVFRLEAIRTGFKKAWQESDYVTIIAVARKIPESILQEDPKSLMWYDQAVTRIGGEA
jgi:hypothetical protein